MKKIILSLFLLYNITSNGQKTNNPILDKKQISQRELEKLSDSPIYRAYEYKDNGGIYNLVLCENQKSVSKTDTLNTKILAICGIKDSNGFAEKWRINDLLENTEVKETNIWFWTKYCSVKDLDGDGYTEPILVYGSRNEDDEIRRVKIIVVYKNKKYVIRAVECVLDYCRSFKKDADWSLLPQKIKSHIDKLVQKIREDQGILLTDG